MTAPWGHPKISFNFKVVVTVGHGLPTTWQCPCQIVRQPLEWAWTSEAQPKCSQKNVRIIIYRYGNLHESVICHTDCSEHHLVGRLICTTRTPPHQLIAIFAHLMSHIYVLASHLIREPRVSCHSRTSEQMEKAAASLYPIQNNCLPRYIK